MKRREISKKENKNKNNRQETKELKSSWSKRSSKDGRRSNRRTKSLNTVTQFTWLKWITMDFVTLSPDGIRNSMNWTKHWKNGCLNLKSQNSRVCSLFLWMKQEWELHTLSSFQSSFLFISFEKFHTTSRFAYMQGDYYINLLIDQNYQPCDINQES